MKNIKIILLFGLIAMVSWGCSDSLSSNNLADKDITFLAVQSSYAPGEVVAAVLQNNSSLQITYGNPFQVLQKIDGKWTYIGPKLYFTLEAYTMKPGGQTTYRVALTDSLFPDHTFSGGQYRLATSVGIAENDYTAKTQPFRVGSNPQQ